ncbi:MAG: hypothetical protein IKE42_06870 [Aquamicrobium sp.]|uniref:hypothetical protein n=1 Tax=Mesorhizobium sp. Pch-S TaxID=2082387 RepID=UPI0010139765|nr:hypothetical protein [Mesorhizobium sp. Pch-S]MBR2687559.1 hypothetical protein [Aquamicrobium sp.]QAZ45233.1 hypothetical protein C1M53_22155 [Mesorhizobium sp. Pch-S]
MRTGKTHGGSDWFSDLANRHLCWAFAASGTTLFAITTRLARAGLLTRGQALCLMRGSMHLHGIAIRILRRQR